MAVDAIKKRRKINELVAGIDKLEIEKVGLARHEWTFGASGASVNREERGIIPTLFRLLQTPRLVTGCPLFGTCRPAIQPRERPTAMPITRALLSVSDKSGLAEFAKELHDLGVELLSTGGTAKALRDAGLPVIDVSEYTGAPELFDGRVKTLHPKVHGGLLHRRDDQEHLAQAKKNDIPPIDLVVVNLYPFEATIKKPGVTLDEAIENIDIGGPSMLRSAAKNHSHVTVIVDPSDYAKVIEEMKDNNGETTKGFREQLAVKVFLRTSQYDAAITNYLGQCRTGTCCNFTLSLPLEQELRYGDNPHQKCSLYGNFSEIFTQVHGK